MKAPRSPFVSWFEPESNGLSQSPKADRVGLNEPLSIERKAKRVEYRSVFPKSLVVWRIRQELNLKPSDP